MGVSGNAKRPSNKPRRSACSQMPFSIPTLHVHLSPKCGCPLTRAVPLGHLEERCCQVQVVAHAAIAWGISRFPILMSMSRSTYATQNCHGYGGVVSCIHEQHGPSRVDIPMASSGVSWRSARYCTRSAFTLPVIAVALCVPVLFRMDSRGISVVLMSSPDYGTVTMPPAVQTPNHGPKGVC